MIRLAIRCRRTEAEAALAELLALAPSGIEEVNEPGGARGVVEYAIYGAPGELPELGELRAAAGGALVEVRSERFPDDWNERWKRFYHPVLIAGRLYVRPPWERPAERGGVTEVVIDPGQAFGTGTHATTSMCLELMLDASRRNRSFLERLRRRGRRSFCDLGCGSGVLAIAAAKLGFAPVLAVDSESAAIEECERNARLNFVDVELQKLDLRSEQPPQADVVTANLTTALLQRIARSWEAGGVRPGIVIASGLLADDIDLVLASLAKAGLYERRRTTNGEWAALLVCAANVLP